MYKILTYPSMKDFKWVIHSNQIKDCPVTIQNIDVAMNIWGKNSEQYTSGGQGLFLTTDIFFVNKISFFVTHSRNICFTAVNHLVDRSVPHIFKAFKDIYQYYLQCGFHISMVHAEGEFAPLKTLIESMPDGPMSPMHLVTVR
jgi:hypothetical protein